MKLLICVNDLIRYARDGLSLCAEPAAVTRLGYVVLCPRLLRDLARAPRLEVLGAYADERRAPMPLPALCTALAVCPALRTLVLLARINCTKGKRETCL